MNNMIDKFKLGSLAILAIGLFPITLIGYIVSYFSKRRPWMTLNYWRKK